MVVSRMQKKTVSEIFAKVDPHLTVIDGSRKHKRRSNQKDWDAAVGTICPRCKRESVRFRPQDGVCRLCADNLNEKEIRDEKKRAKLLRQIEAHNVRITKKRR